MKIKYEISKISRLNEKSENTRSKKWVLRLYIAGQTIKAITAINNLKSICEDKLKGRYHIQVIDLLLNPQLGHDDQIIAIPTLMRKFPTPVKLIIGDLSNRELVLAELNFNGNNLSGTR